jgi:hypothetical protein
VSRVGGVLLALVFGLTGCATEDGSLAPPEAALVQEPAAEEGEEPAVVPEGEEEPEAAVEEPSSVAAEPVPAGSQLSCQEREATMRATFRAFEASRQCAVSSDCVVFNSSNACAARCQRAYNKKALSKLEAAKSELNRTVCDGFRESGCRAAQPRCARADSADCIEGQCVMVHGPSRKDKKRLETP